MSLIEERQRRVKWGVVVLGLIMSMLLFWYVLSSERINPDDAFEEFKAYCSARCETHYLLSNDCLNHSYIFECLCLDSEGKLRPETWMQVKYLGQNIFCNDTN